MIASLRHIYLRERAVDRIRRFDLGMLVVDMTAGVYTQTNPKSRSGELASTFRAWCEHRLATSPSHVHIGDYEGINVLDVALGMFHALHTNRPARDACEWAFDGEIKGLPIPSATYTNDTVPEMTLSPCPRHTHTDDVVVNVPIPRWMKSILPADLESLGKAEGFTVLASAAMMGSCLDGRHVQRCQAFTVQEIVDECGGEDETIRMFFTKEEWSTLFVPFAREIRSTSNKVTVLTALMIGLGLPGALTGVITTPWEWHTEWKKAAKIGPNFIESHHDRSQPFKKSGCGLSTHHLALVAVLSGYRTSPSVVTLQLGYNAARESLCRLWIKLQEKHGSAVGKGVFDITMGSMLLATMTQLGERSWLSDAVCPPKAFSGMLDGSVPMETLIWSILSQNRVSSVGAALRKRWKQQFIVSTYNRLVDSAPLHPGWVTWWREIGRERYGSEGNGWVDENRLDRQIAMLEAEGLIIANYNVKVQRELIHAQ
jgi:hypothetical protein